MRLRRVYAELLGTTVLILGVCLCNGASNVVPAVLWAAIICTGFISGAQYNPAMTTAIVLIGLVRRRMSVHDFWEHMLYYPIHLVGGLLGAYLSWSMKGTTYAQIIPEDSSLLRAYFGEVTATSLLILVATVGGMLQDSIFLYTLAVCAVIFLNLTIFTPISSACMNPAVGITVNIVDAVNYGYFREPNFWIFIAGPLTASIVGTLLYLAINPEELRTSHKRQKVETLLVLKQTRSVKAA